MSGVYDVAVSGGASAATPSTSTTRSTTSRTWTATISTGCAARASLVLVVRAGAVGGHDRRARVDEALRARCSREKGIRHELDLWGHDVPHDWPSWRARSPHHLPRFV